MTEDVHHQLQPGDVVTDRELAPEERSEAIVVNTPPKLASAWTVNGRATVAEDNPGYRADAPVVCVVYRDTLKAHYPYYTGVAPLRLGELLRQGVTYYAFPEPRLVRVGHLDAIELSIDELRPAPFHARNFDVEQNRSFIDEIAERGHPMPYPLVRINGERFELVNGHKRVWASHVAGLETIPCLTVHQGGEEFARAWARRHLEDYSGAEQSVAIERLQAAGFGRVATDYATVETDGGVQ